MGIEDRNYAKKKLSSRPPRGYWRSGYNYEYKQKPKFPRWIVWSIVGLILLGLLWY